MAIWRMGVRCNRQITMLAFIRLEERLPTAGPPTRPPGHSQAGLRNLPSLPQPPHLEV